MEQAIQLFGYLILAVLGFVFPVVTVLLSLNREGLSKLAAQYENERSQSEDNIKEQLGKMSKAADIDESAIKKSIKKLKSIKKAAKIKLSYLDPKKQVLRLFVPLMLAFLGVVAAFLILHFTDYFIDYAYLYPLLVSLVAFSYSVFVLWKLVGIIMEVRRIIDTDRKDMDTRTTELLTALVEGVKETGQYYLQKVYINIDGDDIVDNSCIITGKANSKTELTLGIINKETRMAKNVEIGFIFPTNLIIEKTSEYSIYREEEQQVVRFNTSTIQGDTYLHITEPLIITPLEQGNHKIRTFVKAENIESTYKHITIKVT